MATALTTPTVARRMRIRELADQLAITAKTIRYCESIGLLPEPQRQASGYRTYGAEDAERLGFVRSAQRFGLRLGEIREVIALRDRVSDPAASSSRRWGGSWPTSIVGSLKCSQSARSCPSS